MSGVSKLMVSKPAQRVVCAGAAGALGAAMLVGVVQAPALAVLTSPVDLLTQANIQLDGAAADDKSGFSVAGAGDVNGDGIADVIIGAPNADNNSRTDSGSSYVVYGNATPTSPVQLGALAPGSTGFRVDGALADDQSGYSVAGAGDVNGDGRADVIIGAPRADPNGSNSGSSYVVYGKANNVAANINLSIALDPTSNGFRIDGAAEGDQNGFSVAGAGDVNGDGKADVIIGAVNADPNGTNSGSSYVVYGKANNAAADIDLASALDPASNGFRIDGAAEADKSGYSVAGAGDVNGDGKADVIIGAMGADPNGNSESGSSYVVYGKANNVAADIDLITPLVPASNGFRIDGAAAGDQSGFSVDGAGDVNGDGKDDVIIGAPRADPNGNSDSGSSYVVYGNANNVAADINLATPLVPASNGFQITGAAEGDRSGRSVAGAGDVNGDGTADVIIGAMYAGPNGNSDSGSSYVVYGKASNVAANINLATPLVPASNGFRIDGAAEGDFSGFSVAGAGDVNGDGGADVIIGAPYADNNSRDGSGSSYVLYGVPPAPPVPPAGKLPQSQKKISRVLPVKGTKVVNVKNARTKQGQKMTAKVTGASSRVLATRGDIVCYTVKKGPKRKLVIKTTGQCANIKIRVVYTAPGNATYLKYRNTITFKTKR